jgi:hypothetical protein
VSEVSVDAVDRTMQALLAFDRRPTRYHDGATGRDITVDVKTAASPAGFLPALVVAGEAVWRDVTGKGFALDIVRDPQALLGYRLRAIGAGNFATVMLATMEAIHQVAHPEAIPLNDFGALWSAVSERLEREMRTRPSATAGAHP